MDGTGEGALQGPFFYPKKRCQQTMTYTEKEGDLFDYGDGRCLVHCISADFALGKGIAAEFQRRFQTKDRLRERYKDYLSRYREEKLLGDCLPVDGVMNLVTKERYWGKPTYQSMEAALQALKRLCRQEGIEGLAMPCIGCGLDRLAWGKVSAMIREVFSDTACDILVVTGRSQTPNSLVKKADS